MRSRPVTLTIGLVGLVGGLTAAATGKRRSRLRPRDGSARRVGTPGTHKRFGRDVLVNVVGGLIVAAIIFVATKAIGLFREYGADGVLAFFGVMWVVCLAGQS